MSEFFPVRVRIWIDPKTGLLADETDDHEELGHVDHEYLSLAEHNALTAELYSAEEIGRRAREALASIAKLGLPDAN